MPGSSLTAYSFADLVVCSDISLQSAFGIGDAVGIIVENRKKDARICFLRPDRSLWLPFRGLRRAIADEVARAPLAAVHHLVRELYGTTLEVSGHGDHALRLVMRHGALTPERIDEIRGKMGAGLVAWKIRPGSMSRLESIMEIEPGKIPELA